MNLKDIEYIVAIAQERSLTRAAEQLFITPSALTQQLNHLEQEIGAPLFFRSRNGWTTTEAGDIYLETAREMLRMRRETYKRLQDVVNTRKGSLSVGFPPERGAAMFTSVYPTFHRRYPEITINVREVSVRKQQQMIAKGDLDIGFMTLCEKHQTDDEYIFINTEELVLAVPKVHPLCRELPPSPPGEFPEIDLSLLRYEPFAHMYKGSTVREFVDDVLRQANFRPAVLFETARAQTIIEMAAANMCCGMVPSFYASSGHDGVAFLALPSHPTWNIKASYKRGSYLSQAAKYFIDLATDYWN